jgi:ABC-type multidrug transport system ATPase subunit
MNPLEFKSVRLKNAGKKYVQSWIFRNVSFEVIRGEKVSVCGNNGAGKSTLLQLISGYITPSEGSVEWTCANGMIKGDDIYKFISFAAPYLELIESFTLEENIRFFCRRKNMRDGMRTDDIIAMAGLGSHPGKPVRNFSSGMKQRLRLALAFLADTPLLLLDEPLSNLDESGEAWYRERCMELSPDRTVVVCSNRVSEETFFCSRSIRLEPHR